MKQLGLILKVNLLSLLALPLLLLSLVFKLVQKALEKALVFVGVACALLALLLLNEIFNNPGGFLEGLGMTIAILIIGGAILGIVIMVLVFCGGIAATVLTAVLTAVMALLGMGFELFHGGYLRLYDICSQEFECLKASETAKARFGCIFWYLLYGLHQVLVFLLSMMFPLSLVAAGGFVVYAIVDVYRSIHGTFGIGIVSYLSMFSVTNVVFTVLDFVIIVLSVVVVVISLGIEWSEWGKTLKAAAQGTDADWAYLAQQSTRLETMDEAELTFAAGKEQQYCQQHMDQLNERLANMELLYEQVGAALQLEEDSALRYRFSEYMEKLNLICEELSHFQGEVPCNLFEQRVIPLITAAVRQEKEINKDVLRILNKHAHTGKGKYAELEFFSGCTSQEALKSRYRALCKIYHPDQGGDTETFQQMHQQYEQRQRELESVEQSGVKG